MCLCVCAIIVAVSCGVYMLWVCVIVEWCVLSFVGVRNCCSGVDCLCICMCVVRVCVRAYAFGMVALRSYAFVHRSRVHASACVGV